MINLDDYSATLKWLLNPSNPIVRYNALRFLLDYPLSNSLVQESLEASHMAPPIKEILEHQNPDGGFLQEKWKKRHELAYVQIGYLPKYVASSWNALFLAQVHIPASEPSIQQLGKIMLQTMYNPEAQTVCFPQLTQLDKKGRRGYGGPCFIGNMLWVLLQFGLGSDSRVKKTFKFLVKYQLYNQGKAKTPSEFPYRGGSDRCWGPHSCYWGVTKTLRAMTCVPSTYWTSAARASTEAAIQFILEHHLIRKCHDPTRFLIPSSNYRSPIHFYVPRTYSSDAIEIATTLLELGVQDPRIDETIEYIQTRRDSQHRWAGKPHPGRFYGTWISKPEQSKWITYRVLRMLKLAKRVTFSRSVVSE